MHINLPLIISADSNCSEIILFPVFINVDQKNRIFPRIKLEELRHVVYSDKFLEERFWHVLRGFMFVRKKFRNKHL